jgi:hypothetical protein
VCSKRIDCSLWKFQGAAHFSVLVSPLRRAERQSETLGGTGGRWLTVGVAFKTNQAPPQGIKELRLPVSGILAAKVRVDQADGGGTFAHRCCHPFD